MSYFVAFNPAVQSSRAPDEKYDSLVGTVQEVTVIFRNDKVWFVECKNGCKLMIATWPTKFFGVLRGVFNKRSKAEDALKNPLPTFDKDGHLL